MKILIAIFIISAIYTIFENTFMLKVRKIKINKGNVRILHISDLHKRQFGNDNHRLLKVVSAQNPDIIIISGDVITRDITDFNDTEKLFHNLSKIAPVYFGLGNHELDLMPENLSKLKAIAENSGVIILDNKSVFLSIKGINFEITGASLKREVYKKDGCYKNLDVYSLSELQNAVGKPNSDAFNLLIAHNPLFADVYNAWGADITFSGHIHGGAVRIPFLNFGLLSPERRFFPRYSKGVYKVGNMLLCVSGGLGKLRLFNPPEIIVYEIS